MKRFSLRIIAIAFLILAPSLGLAEDGMSSAAETLEDEKVKLYWAISQKNLGEVKRRYSNLIDQGNFSSWGKGGWPNPLVYSIPNSSLEVVEFFLDQPSAKDWLKENDLYGETTIHSIVRYHELRLLKRIMSFSEIEELLNEKNKNGTTPFELTVLSGEIEMVRFLLNFPQVQAQLANRNRYGETTLHLAVSSDSMEMVKIIFGLPEARALILANQNYSDNILHLAVSRDRSFEILAFILTLPEALDLVTSIGDKGDTVLHRASPNAFLFVAKFLENRPQYLNLFKVKNRMGNTPLAELFIRHGDIDLSQFFGLKHFERLLFEKDDQGRNLIHIAVDADKPEIAVQVVRFAKNPRKLFEEPNDEGTSPLGLAVQLGKDLQVGALIAEGLNFENVLINHKRVSAIDYLTQNLPGDGPSLQMQLLQFLLSRPAEESQSSGWSRLQ